MRQRFSLVQTQGSGLVGKPPLPHPSSAGIVFFALDNVGMGRPAGCAPHCRSGSACTFTHHSGKVDIFCGANPNLLQAPSHFMFTGSEQCFPVWGMPRIPIYFTCLPTSWAHLLYPSDGWRIFIHFVLGPSAVIFAVASWHWPRGIGIMALASWHCSRPAMAMVGHFDFCSILICAFIDFGFPVISCDF